MKCKHCEAELAEGVKFCGACGKSVDDATTKSVDKDGLLEKIGAKVSDTVKSLTEELKGKLDTVGIVTGKQIGRAHV